MSFEIASSTSCGQSLLARATATNKIVFVNAKIETTARTASAIGNATALPTLTNPVTGEINSVTYSLNQTRVTVRFNNLVTTANFHTVWLMAKLASEADSAAVPICAVVSSEPVYIPSTSQSDTHIDIHLNLSFVRADGTVSITEGPAWMISDQIQYRNEVRAELDEIEADIDDLQSTVVTLHDMQTITGEKTFSGGINVTAPATLGTTTMTGTLTAETIYSYGNTPRTASTSSSTGYDLGSTSYRWRNVYAQYGEFNTSISTAGSLSVTGASTLTGNATVGGTLGVTGATTLASTLGVTGATTLAVVIAGAVSSYSHTPRTASTSSSTGYDLGTSDTRWRYVHGRYGDFSHSISTAGSLSVTGASTLTGNATVGGTLGVTGATTLAGVTSGAISSYSHTPRTASTSSSTGYDLGASDTRWKYVYARYGNFSYSLTVDGTVTATSFSGKFTTARNIDGMAFDGSAAITHYGTCSTAAATAAKVVTKSGFSLETGARIAVKFTYTNTASSPTLNVNSTGAKAIVYRGTSAVSDSSSYYRWQAGDIVEFIYDGTNWVIVGWQTYAYNSYSATNATYATYATNLRYSSTSVLTATSTTSVTSAATISPSTSGGYSLGNSTYRWNYVYANYGNFASSISTSGTLSVTGESTFSSGVVMTGGLYFNSDKTVKMNLYNSGIDITGHLTPVSSSTYDLGSYNYPWQRLFVNYISGAGVAHSIAGYGSGTAQDATFPVGSLILTQITTATNPSGTQLANSTIASPTYFGDIPASKLRKISLYASGNKGSVTCWQNTNATLNGTWRCIGDVWSANVTNYPPVVLVVRIA